MNNRYHCSYLNHYEAVSKKSIDWTSWIQTSLGSCGKLLSNGKHGHMHLHLTSHVRVISHHQKPRGLSQNKQEMEGTHILNNTLPGKGYAASSHCRKERILAVSRKAWPTTLQYYIGKEWNLQSTCLQWIYLADDHTAVNLAEAVEKNTDRVATWWQ